MSIQLRNFWKRFKRVKSENDFFFWGEDDQIEQYQPRQTCYSPWAVIEDLEQVSSLQALRPLPYSEEMDAFRNRK